MVIYFKNTLFYSSTHISPFLTAIIVLINTISIKIDVIISET